MVKEAKLTYKYIIHDWTCKSSAKVVVLLVLLVWWMDIPGQQPTEPYQVIEFFAGVGRIAALAKHCGYKSAAIDLTYGQDVGARMGKRSPMDLNSNAGMVFRVCMHIVRP